METDLLNNYRRHKETHTSSQSYETSKLILNQPLHRKISQSLELRIKNLARLDPGLIS